MTKKKPKTHKRSTCSSESQKEQPDRMTVELAPKVLQVVASPEEASKAVRRYIENWNLGASEWCSKTSGYMRRNGHVVARVAYNGTVWTPGAAWNATQLWPEVK